MRASVAAAQYQLIAAREPTHGIRSERPGVPPRQVRRTGRNWTGHPDGRNRPRSRIRTWRHRVADRRTNLRIVEAQGDSTSELFVQPLESSLQALRTSVGHRRLAVRRVELLDQRRRVRDDFDVVRLSVVEQDCHARGTELVRDERRSGGNDRNADQQRRR